ncbi:MAG: DMT family transporter [Methanobacteriota archaeon]
MDTRDRAVAATVVSSFLWGSSFVVAGYGVGIADPMLFLLLRFLIATPIVMAVWPYRRALRSRIIWTLAAFNAAAFVMQYVALGWTTATNVALLISMDLVFVSAASVYFLSEKATWRLGVSLSLGLAGVFLVEYGAGTISVSSEALWGDLLSLGAALSWTVYIILSKKALSGENDMSAEELTAGVCIATTVPLLFVLPFVSVSGSVDWACLLLLSAYLAVFTTILAYVLWYKGLKHLPASTTSIILLLEIAFAAVLAYIVLGERVGPFTVVGGVLICAAALLTVTGK